MAAGGGKAGAGVLAWAADTGVAAGEGNPRRGYSARRNRGRAVAEPSVYPGSDSRVQFSACRAERQSVEPGFADERGACRQAAGWKNSVDCGWRTITGGHRIDGAGFDCEPAAVAATGNDSRTT